MHGRRETVAIGAIALVAVALELGGCAATGSPAPPCIGQRASAPGDPAAPASRPVNDDDPLHARIDQLARQVIPQVMVDVPFKSTVAGAMHECGHDAHIAMVLGVAAILAQMKDQLPGSVKFVFQPGEEGPPPGETDGAVALIEEGVLTKEPRTDVIFGLHVLPQLETGQIGYRSGSLMGSDDLLDIVVRGRQTTGETPWTGVDPIVVAAQIVLGLQAITSRQMDIVKAPVVLTVEKIAGGERNETVPDHVDMSVMLRAFDPQMRADAKARVRRTAENIAAAAGATADVREVAEMAMPGVYNDPTLTARMLPTLARVAGNRGLVQVPVQPFADDFSFYTEKVPGLFVLMGIRKPGATLDEYPPNHSPRFRIDETGYELGVRTLANLVVDYMLGAPPNR
jgi:amidohydrolase